MQARFGGPQGVYATGHKKELVDAMKEFGVTSPGEALLRLLEQSDGGAILRFGVESDLVAILKHPTASVACDCGAVAGNATHPRYYGSFPRVLGRYVREQQVLTWEDAVRKMTGLPAATIGLVNRGLHRAGDGGGRRRLRSGHASWTTPPSRRRRRCPRACATSWSTARWCGGTARPTGDKAGAVLLRGPHEPSRSR